MPQEGPDGIVNLGLEISFEPEHAPFTNGYIPPNTHSLSRQKQKLQV